jgi:DNA-binding response OmpR family regulator
MTLEEQVILSSPTALPELLFVDSHPAANAYVTTLRRQYRVTIANAASTALTLLKRSTPAVLITELNLSDGRGEDVCRRAKEGTGNTPPAVLVMTSNVERVPVALAAGCDGVLLKPFAPNLLYSRIARLLRARSLEIRMRAVQQMAKSAHLSERAAQLSVGTNKIWPTTHCPYCSHAGIVNFDHAQYRQEWFACLACQKVWIARSHEHMPAQHTVNGADYGWASET